MSSRRSSAPDVPSLSRLRGVVLVLTSRCNLRCSYCYQNEKGADRMSWGTARRAIDTLLRSEEIALEVDLWGGEPLLERPLMRKLVEYVAAGLPETKTVDFSTSTNGVLLDDETVRFLAGHRITTQLSFDGVPGAQFHRDRSSFETVDRALRSWKEQDPASFRALLSIALTVHPGNVSVLPQSVRYFLDLGIESVAMAPILTHAAGWKPGHIDELDRRFEEIFEASVSCYLASGRIPLTMFRGVQTARTFPESRTEKTPTSWDVSRPLCGAVEGAKLVVDANGGLHGCATFVDSYQRWTTSFARRRLEPLRLGTLTDPELGRRLAAFPAAVEHAELFHGREKKRSSYGKCAECPYRDRCCICPVSIAHVPGNTDPHRIPDFPCAFRRVTGKYAVRFEERIRPVEVLLGDTLRRRKQAFLERIGQAGARPA